MPALYAARMSCAMSSSRRRSFSQLLNVSMLWPSSSATDARPTCFLVACTCFELDMLDGKELCVSQFEDIALRLPTRRLHKITNLPVLERMQGATKLKPPEGVACTARLQ